MSYLGTWQIDDLLTFYANTHRFDTGAATDADSAPSFRVYEDETGTPLLTGSLALLDSSNTTGFYSEQITLSAANGFEVGKQYSVYIEATVNSVVGATHHTFQVEAVSTPPTAAAIADAVWEEDLTDHSGTAGSVAEALEDAANISAAFGFPKNVGVTGLQFIMLDSADHFSPKTGLVDGDFTLKETSAGTLSGTITEVGGGVYAIDTTNAEMNFDVDTFHFKAAGADDTWITLKTTP